MLTTFQQVELMVAGLRAKTRPDNAPPPLLSVLEDAPDHPASRGYDCGLIDAPFGSEAITDYIVGRWAKTGDEAFLREIVRRALLRDGSTASMIGSLYAADLLRSALESSEDFAAILARLGYSAPPAYGSFIAHVLDEGVDGWPEEMLGAQRVSYSEALANAKADGLADPVEMRAGLAPSAMWANPIPPPPIATLQPAVDHSAAAPVAPVAPVVPIAVASANSGRVDSVQVVELPGGVIVALDFPDGRRPISVEMGLGVASELAADLSAAVWSATTPFEGAAWDDDQQSGKSFLCVIDIVLAEQNFADAELFGQLDAFWPHPGLVIGRVSPQNGGFVGEFGIDNQHTKRFDDRLTAKAAVANLARAYLSAQPAAPVVVEGQA